MVDSLKPLAVKNERIRATMRPRRAEFRGLNNAEA